MKKFIFLPVLALLVASCSNDTSVPSESGDTQTETTGKYLNISLMSPGGLGRADDDDDYQNGSAEENKINLIRFYFFDVNGNPSQVAKLTSTQSYLSYIDWYPIDSDITTPESSTDHVEKIANVTLGINMPAQNNGLPALVVAVINPPASLQSIQGNPNLTTLRDNVADFCTGLTNSNFVMTNSVYAVTSSDGTGVSIIDATPILEENYSDTMDEAILNTSPLKIWVERVVAKAVLSIGIEPAPATANPDMTIYPLDEPTTVGGQSVDLYLNLLGWNITATPDKSRLIKSINASWGSGNNFDWISEEIFGNDQSWNLPGFHRSFWAINPPATLFSYNYGAFNNESTAEDNIQYADALSITEGAYTYLQENAAPADDVLSSVANPTKLILPAQLVNAAGTPQSIGRWANRVYLLDNMLEAVCNSLNLYQKTTTAGTTTYTQITPTYLQIMTAQQLYGTTLPDDVAQYYCYAQLSDGPQGGESITWYNGNTDAAVALNTDQVNSYIIDRIGQILVWKEGYTYYYVDIRHLGDKEFPGFEGVVRNHIYQININSIKGLGTPVFNPDEVIYPATPEEDDQVLTAIVNILQWRIVSQDYTIEWP